MKMNKLWWRRVLSWRWIGPVVVVAIIAWAGPAKVWAMLARANLWLVVAALGMAVPLAVIKGIRWQMLLRTYQIDLPLGRSISMYAMGMTMAAVTPGHVGDFMKIFPLLQEGHAVARALACNVVDRLLDVAFVFLAGYAGMWYFSQSFSPQVRIVSLLAAVGLLAVVAAVARFHLVRKMAIRLVPAKYRSVIRDSWNDVVLGLFGHRFGRAVLLGLGTVVFWAGQFLAVFLCAKALALNVSFVYLSACVAIVTVASFVPITVAGAGTRDAIFIVLLSQTGVARQESVALSSLVLAVFAINCVTFYLMSLLSGSRSSAPARTGKPQAPPDGL